MTTTTTRNIVTLHRSTWLGGNIAEHSPIVACEPRTGPAAGTIPFADRYDYSTAIEVSAPAGWEMAESASGEMLLYDARGEAATLRLSQDGRIVHAHTSRGTTDLRIIETAR